MNTIKNISRKIIVDANFFTVYQSEITLSNDSIHIHKNVERKPSISIFPLSDRFDIYLIKQYRYLVKSETLEAPAGMIDIGEDPKDSAIRELREETGLVAKNVTKLAVLDSAASIITWQSHLFLAQNFTQYEQQLEEFENIQVVKIPFDEAVQKVMTGEIRTGATAFGILLIDKLRKEGKI